MTTASDDVDAQQDELPLVAEQLLARIREAVKPRYTLGRLLGRGGMAWVFLAKDISLNRSVAIKVVVSLPSDASAAEARFRREAVLAASLTHPHIVPVYEVGERDSVSWFAMQYVDGRALDEVLRLQKRLNASHVRALLIDIAGALSYAHKRGVIHRDVKPGNIMIDAEHRVFVTDFGIARTSDAPRLTTTGGIVGTPLYMSPEQFNGQTLTPSVDQYALGCVAFEMLTGRPPFPAGDVSLLLRGHLLDPVPSVLELEPEVPPDLARTVERMLAKRAAERFASMDDLVAALNGRVLDALDGVSVENAGARKTRRWLVAGTLSIAALFVLATSRTAREANPAGSAPPVATPARNVRASPAKELREPIVGSRTVRSVAGTESLPSGEGPSESGERTAPVDSSTVEPRVSPRNAIVFIGSRLRGSLVFVDGRLVLSLPDVGVHPLTVLPGARRISVRLDECQSVDTLLNLVAGDTVRLNRRTPRCQ